MHINSRVSTRVAAVCLFVGMVAGAVPTFATTDGTVAAAASAEGTAEVAARGGAPAVDATSWTGAELGGWQSTVFALALEAASRAVTRGDVAGPQTLTVIDF